MKKISEKTLTTALVNFRCVGYFGRCLRPFSLSERSGIVDSIISRGWMTEDLAVTPAGDAIVKKNLHLCQY